MIVWCNGYGKKEPSTDKWSNRWHYEAAPSPKKLILLVFIRFIAKNNQVRKAAKFRKPAAMTSSLRSATRKVWQQLFSVVTAFQLRMVGNVLFWQLQPVQNKPILSTIRPFQTHIWSVPYLALPAGRRVRRGSTGHPTHREINGFSLD